jgi:hypothetical protein
LAALFPARFPARWRPESRATRQEQNKIPACNAGKRFLRSLIFLLFEDDRVLGHGNALALITASTGKNQILSGDKAGTDEGGGA